MYGVREEVKLKIMEEMIEKSYVYDVESLVLGRRRWKKTGQAFETMSKILVAVGGIISFSSGYFDVSALSFLSGSISVISIAFLQFSSFCYIENKKQANELNVILKRLGLETIPELSRDVDANVLMKQSPNNIIQMERNMEKYLIENNSPKYIQDNQSNYFNDNNIDKNKLNQETEKI